MENGYGVFDGSFSSNPLNRVDDHPFRFFVGRHLGIFHDVIDIRHGIGFSFIFERFHQFFLGLFNRKA
ncbi:hypothetical protein SDC9_173629 [bioreactor metagenome]|uniref:Uncharacterized protein n=1 Tax=bioreactor metagenome TaxID=1076179 RepID=A0A645GHN7_9ZZZZ